MNPPDRDAQPGRRDDEGTSVGVPDVPVETVAWVEKLHHVVDELAASVAERSRERLTCRAGCSGCCADGLTVFVIEAARIARAHEALLTREAPGPEGACAFLDGEGRCRIYAERPYVCRTQGLPLRWIEEEGSELVEARDICPLNEAGGPPLEALPADAFFPLGPFEARLADMQSRTDGGAGRRVPLRALFRTPSPRTGSDPADSVEPKRSLPVAR